MGFLAFIPRSYHYKPSAGLRNLRKVKDIEKIKKILKKK